MSYWLSSAYSVLIFIGSGFYYRIRKAIVCTLNLPYELVRSSSLRMIHLKKNQVERCGSVLWGGSTLDGRVSEGFEEEASEMRSKG